MGFLFIFISQLFIDNMVDSTLYQNILKINMRPSIQQLMLGQNWVLKQDNDPKHTSKLTSEKLKREKNE